MAWSVSVGRCREQQAPALLVGLRMRKGERQTGMLSVPTEAFESDTALLHRGACPRQSHWFNGGFNQGWYKTRFLFLLYIYILWSTCSWSTESYSIYTEEWGKAKGQWSQQYKDLFCKSNIIIDIVSRPLAQLSTDLIQWRIYSVSAHGLAHQSIRVVSSSQVSYWGKTSCPSSGRNQGLVVLTQQVCHAHGCLFPSLGHGAGVNKNPWISQWV